MTIGPEHETPRPAEGDGFGDAVTFAFGDPQRRVYGSARVGLVPGSPVTASGLGLLFEGDDAIAAAGVSGVEVADPSWERAGAGDVTVETLQPLRAWRAQLDSDEGGFDLCFEALSAPAELGPGAAAADAAGLRGYEQLCSVSGEVRTGSGRATIECLGQRGHQWGASDWRRIAASRTLSAWIAPDLALALASVSPDGADGHESDARSAFLFAGAGEDDPGGPAVPVAIADPRLSTTYDGDDRQLRAGLELWIGEDDEFPRRLAGEAICGTTLELGRLTLRCAFFHWHMEGREGVGRYDLLRRTG